VTRIELEKKVLSENDKIAARLRQQFNSAGVTVLNLVSSPGSGKTTLFEKTLGALAGVIPMALVAGDVQTDNDARRLEAAGAEIVRPIITGGACHLDAAMIEKSLAEIDLDQIRLLVIENVGNLVCPSSYDLGEDQKVVLISTTEGDDKPQKYPSMFRRSSTLVINKIDLLAHTDFSMAAVRANALRINGQLTIHEVSCRQGVGLDGWYTWLTELVAQKHPLKA
jgi:hydrogenase nickel incorporation protein HypB